jgi:DNA-binding HxlR family transcriptional regulator
LLIYALLAGPQRHAELRRRVAGITQKVLTVGKTLQEPLAAICAWAVEHHAMTSPP